MSEEIMVQKFSKLLKNTNPKIQEIHTISSRNFKKSPGHAIVIPKKTKDKHFHEEAEKKREITFK